MIKALRMHPQPRKRSSPKKKKQGNQGASASHKAPWAEEAKEAGAAAADVGVEAKSWPPPLQAHVEKAPSILLSAAGAAAEGDPSSALRFTAITGLLYYCLLSSSVTTAFFTTAFFSTKEAPQISVLHAHDIRTSFLHERFGSAPVSSHRHSYIQSRDAGAVHSRGKSYVQQSCGQ
jgi:hypothetical protein